MSHAGTGLARSGGRESRRRRPPQPVPTPGRPPGLQPALTPSGSEWTPIPRHPCVRPPLHPNPHTWASRLPAPRAPRPRRPAPRGSLETPPARVARVTSRLPTSKPLRATPSGNCSFALGGSWEEGKKKKKKAWRAGIAGTSRRSPAPPSGNGSPPVASVPLQSPEHFRSPEGREGWRRVFCRLQPRGRALRSARAVFPFLPALAASTLPPADSPPLSARREVLTPRARASGEAGTAELCARPPVEGSGSGGRLCALAHARSSANTGLNAAGPRGGDFFFPFRTRARARKRALSFFLPGARECARALTTFAWVCLLGARLEGNRSVRGVFPQHPQGRYPGAPSRSTLSHRSSRVSPHTLYPSLSSQVIGMDGSSLEQAVTPSFLPTLRAGTPERVGTRVWWPLAGRGSSRALSSTGASGPLSRGLPWRPCEPPFSR